MKIAYCLKSTYNSGGMERIVIRKANALVKRGFDVTIITTDQQQRSSFFEVDPNVKIVDLNINYDNVLNYPILKKLSIQPFLIRKHRNRLQKLCERERYDIVISTFGNEIYFLHKIKHIGKRIAEIHFSKNYRLFFNQSRVRKFLNRVIIYRNELKVSKLDALVCLTQEDSKKWNKVRNLYIIPNFIENKNEKISTCENKRAIAVGRLSYQKGYDYLLESWRIVANKFPDWQLEIYGGGELKNYLVKLRDKLDLNDIVKFQEPVSNINDKLAEASIFCLSSRFEGLPMVILEAMSTGLPIVSFDCECGPRDLLGNNNAGIIVPQFDTKKFADAICSLISNKNLRKAMGKDSYKEIDNYLVDDVVDKWISLFQRLNQ